MYCKMLHWDVQHRENIPQEYGSSSIISILRLTQKVHRLSLCCTNAMNSCSIIGNMNRDTGDIISSGR